MAYLRLLRAAVAMIASVAGCCHAPAVMSDQTQVAAPATTEALAVATVAQSIRSCPARGLTQEVPLEIVAEAGRIGGVSYFLGDRLGKTGLMWLRGDGSPGFRELPLPADRCVVEGHTIRCLHGPVRELDGRITPLKSMHVAVADDGKLGACRVTSWVDAPFMSVRAAASNGRRALLVFKAFDGDYGHYASLWNVASGQRSGPLFPLGRYVDLLAARCDERRCSLIAVQGDGPGRRPMVLHGSAVDSSAPGELNRLLLAEDHVIAAAVVRRGERDLLLWQSIGDEQLHLVGVEDGRRVIGPLVAGVTIETRGDLVALAGEGAFAVRSEDGWSAWTVDPDGSLHHAGALKVSSVGLKSGRTADGLLLAALTGEVQYESVGEWNMHFWSFDAKAAFRPDGAAGGRSSQPLVWTSLLTGVPAAGPNRGGYEADILTRPDRAAVLVMPRGDANAATRFIPWREPCPPLAEPSG